MAETIRVVMVNHAAQDINVSPDDLWCAIVEDYVAAGKFRTEGTVEALDDPSALYGGYRLCLNRESIVDERIVRITERDEAARRLSAVADYLSVPGGMRVFATYHAQERLNGARFSIDCHAELGIATPPDRLEAKLNGMRIEAHAQLASYLASVRSRLEDAS